MTSAPSSDVQDSPAFRSPRARGILLLIVAVSFMGSVDGLSKVLVHDVSFGQIMLARYGIAVLALLAGVGPSKWPVLFRTTRPGQQILRAITPVLIGGTMVLAVKFLPLSDSTVILFAGPFLVVALSGWFLKERVPASSWLGVCLGFIAVLIVARPGFGELSAYTVLPAAAAFFYAVFQLQSRQLGAAGEAPLTTLAWTLAIGALVVLPIALVQWVPPSLEDWLLLAALGLCFGAGHYFIAKAFSLAPANVLTPFSYVQIISATIFGLVAFREIPDAWTMTGTVLILLAGGYVFTRGKA